MKKVDETVKKVDEKTASLMVSLGVDEPLQETEYGMMNPYRTGLSQFLANEEAKEQERAEQAAREMERRAHALQESSAAKLAGSGEDNLAVSSTEETEGTELQPLSNPYAKEEEFKFTIDADDEDEELQKIEVEEGAEG